jgi:hypothetical protein
VTWSAELSVYRAPGPDDPRAIPAIDNIQLLRGEYDYARGALWRELERHRGVHGCADDACELRDDLRGAWARVDDMSRALDFVLLGTVPVDEFGRVHPGSPWVPEFVAGPWPDPTWAHEEFMSWLSAFGGLR